LTYVIEHESRAQFYFIENCCKATTYKYLNIEFM